MKATRLASADNFRIEGPSVEIEQLINLRHLARQLPAINTRITRGALPGSYRSAHRGRGMDFDEVRIYQPGDDVRSIDWRVTAKTSKTHTKLFKEERERPVILMVDQRPSMFFGSQVTFKSAMAAQIATLIAWSAHFHNDRVGGLVFNQTEHQEINPKRNKKSVLSLIQSIAKFNNQLFSEQIDQLETFPYRNVFEEIRRVAKPGSAIILISDFNDYSEETEKILYKIKRHADVYAIRIADMMEKELPQLGTLTFTDGRDRKQLDTRLGKVRKDYSEDFSTFETRLTTSFTSLGIPFHTVWTGDDPLDVLIKFFAR